MKYLQDEGYTQDEIQNRKKGKGKENKETDMEGNKEKEKEKKNKKANTMQKVSKHISASSKYYPKLYSLAMEVVKVVREDIDAFPRLSETKNKNISKTYMQLVNGFAQDGHQFTKLIFTALTQKWNG